MRVITGKYKNHLIETLDSKDTRPTSEKIRESMFSSIGEIVSGNILDLFAGSGALGIEALSRGAESGVFVDGAGDAVKIIKNNVKDMDEEIEVYRNDFKRALKALKNRNRQFDIIFLDPPYKKGLIEEALALIKEYATLKENGIIIIEAKDDEQMDLQGFHIWKEQQISTIQYKILKEG